MLQNVAFDQGLQLAKNQFKDTQEKATIMEHSFHKAPDKNRMT